MHNHFAHIHVIEPKYKNGQSNYDELNNVVTTGINVSYDIHFTPISLTCFKSYFPVFAVEIGVYEVPEDVGAMRQGEGMEKLRHSQGGQLTKLGL